MIVGWDDERSYEDRLAQCKLQTIKCRRLRGDLIEVFKILKGYDNICYKDFL